MPDSDYSHQTVWIAWERQRRSAELASALGAHLHIALSHFPRPARYAMLSVQTAALLLRHRPSLLIVQNPSIVLAALACALRPLCQYRLVVDRHSNFKLSTLGSHSPKWWLFHLLSRWTIRQADLTIVTNPGLSRLVEEWGGRAFVLQDRLPTLQHATRRKLGPGYHVVCVSSFDQDEPIEEVAEAASLLHCGVTVHVTGDHRRCRPAIRDSVPANLRFTGFLPEADYQSLLASADAVMVLTKQDSTLVCGAYEAVSLGQPLVLSDTSALREYFQRGAVFTHNRGPDLALAIRDVLAHRRRLAADIGSLADELRVDWNARFETLRSTLHMLAGPAVGPAGRVA